MMADLTEKEIKAQLRRIVESHDFTDSPRLVQFLEYVVGQALKGQQGRITQYKIAVEGLGYDRDFDPSSNPSVRIMARRLRRALNRYYSNSGSRDPICFKLPKGGYAPVFADNQEEEKHRISEYTHAAATPGPAEIHEPSIAVFELEALGPGEANTIIAGGLTSELLVALTRFTGITVIGPLSTSSHPPIQLKQVYNEFGALFVLRGRIQAHQQLVRINMELVETGSGKGQWAQSFEYDLGKTPLFEIQDEIASLVSGAVADSAGTVFRRLDFEGYPSHLKFSDITKALLCYNHAWITHFPDDWKQAYQELEKALARHPENALLNALLANVHYGNAMHEMDLDPESVTKMQSLANKAIALDPALQVAQYNKVVINAFFDKVDACVSAARKTVSMNPNHARILAGSAVAVISVGAYEMGKELIERAKLLNPQYPGWYFFVDFVINSQQERFDAAWENAQLIRTPGILWQPLIRAAALGQLGRGEEARPFLEELLQIKPKFLQRPREYIRPLFVTDEHVEMVWNGLLRAGIEPDAG